MKVRELVTTWGWDIDMKPLEKLNEHLKGVRETVMHLGELVLGEGASLFGLAETTADAGVGFKRVAEAVGTTTTKLQELNFAAKQWDVHPEAVQAGLSRLSRLAVQAAQGSSGAIRSLGMAGITNFMDQKTGNMLRSDQLLQQVAAHFRTMHGDAMKAGLAVQVFGRAGKEMMPILNRMGPEFDALAKKGRDLGYVMGDEAIEASEKFKESTNMIRAMLTGLRNTIGVALMPAVEKMVDDVIKWYTANRQVINSQIVEFAKQLSDVVHGAFQMVVMLANATMFLAHHLGGLGNVLKIVTAGFIAWTTLGIIAEIVEITGAVIKLVQALKLAAIWEGIATGGMSTLLGVAAVGASLGVGAYALDKMSGGGMPQQHSERGKRYVVHHTDNRKFDIHLPPGTPKSHAQEVMKLINEDKEAEHRVAAFAASSPVSH